MRSIRSDMLLVGSTPSSSRVNSHVAHLAVAVVQMRLRQSQQFFLQGERLQIELSPVEGLRIAAPVAQVSAKPVPETEQPGHNSQCIPAKLLR